MPQRRSLRDPRVQYTGGRSCPAHNTLPGACADLVATGKLLREFLEPPWRAIAEARVFTETWPPAGPWRAP
jgi:hypothetical protein